jgi:ACS family allantoate permease-like MFS transporter
MPDSPASAHFFNEREKTIAVERLRVNRTGIKNTVFKPSQALEALYDPQVWLFCFWMFFSSVPNIAGSFLPLIIEDLGFTGLETTLLTIPSGGVEVVAMMVAGGLSLLVQNYRTVIMFGITVPTLIGAIFLYHYPEEETWIRAVGCWLLLCAPGAYAVLLSLITSNIAGFSKKITTTAMVRINYSRL